MAGLLLLPLPLGEGRGEGPRGSWDKAPHPNPLPEGRAKTPSADTADRCGPSVAAEGTDQGSAQYTCRFQTRPLRAGEPQDLVEHVVVVLAFSRRREIGATGRGAQMDIDPGVLN